MVNLVTVSLQHEKPRALVVDSGLATTKLPFWPTGPQRRGVTVRASWVRSWHGTLVVEWQDARRDSAAFVFVAGPRRSDIAKGRARAAQSCRIASNAVVYGWRAARIAPNISSHERQWMNDDDASSALVSDGVALRAMTAADLAAAHALTDELRWPHRPADWEQAFRHAEGLVAERDGQIVGTGLRWRWGPQHATIGLVVVAPACQGRRVGHRLMTALLDGLEGCSVLLHATSRRPRPL